MNCGFSPFLLLSEVRDGFETLSEVRVRFTHVGTGQISCSNLNLVAFIVCRAGWSTAMYPTWRFRVDSLSTTIDTLSIKTSLASTSVRKGRSNRLSAIIIILFEIYSRLYHLNWNNIIQTRVGIEINRTALAASDFLRDFLASAPNNANESRSKRRHPCKWKQLRKHIDTNNCFRPNGLHTKIRHSGFLFSAAASANIACGWVGIDRSEKKVSRCY